MNDKQFDLLVIGAGPGGYVASIRAAQLGLKVGVIEKSELGGVCLNWGCIPTKALIRSAEIYNTFKNAKKFGLVLDSYDFKFEQVVKRSRQIAARSSKGIAYLLKKNGVTHIQGTAKIKNSKEVDLLNESGEVTESLKTGKIIIASSEATCASQGGPIMSPIAKIPGIFVS